MYQSKFRSVLRRVALLSLAAALCASLAACKPKDPADAAASGSPAQSAVSVQPVVAPLEEILETLARAGLEDYDSFAESELETVLSHTCDAALWWWYARRAAPTPLGWKICSSACGMTPPRVLSAM